MSNCVCERERKNERERKGGVGGREREGSEGKFLGECLHTEEAISPDVAALHLQASPSQRRSLPPAESDLMSFPADCDAQFHDSPTLSTCVK